MSRIQDRAAVFMRRGGALVIAFGAGVVATSISLGGGGTAVAQEAGEVRMPPEMQAEWEAYVALQEPSEHHASLAAWIGEWDCAIEVFMDPAAPPMQSRGSARFSWLFEGRWLQQQFNGEVMGRPFEGYGISGYDNFRKQYVDMWVDSMSTSLMTMTGGSMPGSDVTVMFGTMDEPMTGEIGKTIRNVVTRHTDDHFTFEMQEVMYGEPFTVMRIEYRRRS